MKFFGGVLMVGGLLGIVFGGITWATWSELSARGTAQWVNPGSTTVALSAVALGLGLWLTTRDDFPRRFR